MTSMTFTREYLMNLKRISKIFDNGMMFDSFSIVDKTRVSMLCVDTNNHFDKRLFLFSEIPDFFINKYNIIEITEDGVEINHVLFRINTESEKNYHNQKVPNIPWEKTRHTVTTMNGNVLKAFCSNDDDYIAFVCDDKSVRIESEIDFDIPRISYTLDGDVSDIPYASHIEKYELNQYRSIIPNRDIEVTFADDYPVMLRWKDDMDNQYMLLIAPRVK